MARANGSIIGPRNLPTASVASGIWSLEEAMRFKAAGIWPKQVASVAYADAAVVTTDLSTYTFSGRALGTPAADRHIVVAVNSASTDANSGNPTVTVDGVAATLLGTASTVSDGSTVARRLALFIAPATANATGDIVVTYGAGQQRCGIGVWAVYGLRSTTPVDYEKGDNTGTPTALTLDVAEDGVVIAAWQSNGSAAARTTTWTNATERYDATVEGFTAHSGADAVTPALGTLTVTATASAALGAIASVAAFVSLR